MAFSNYRITALMLFYVAFAASGVEAEVIRQHLTVGENENAMALTAAEGADQDRRFWCFMGRGVRRHANFALALANSGLDAYRVRYFRRGSNPLCNCWDAWTKTVSSATTAILRRPETSVASVCSASHLAGPSPLPAPAIAASERTLYAHCSSCMEAPTKRSR
jgi:hypothetical protein